MLFESHIDVRISLFQDIEAILELCSSAIVVVAGVANAVFVRALQSQDHIAKRHVFRVANTLALEQVLVLEENDDGLAAGWTLDKIDMFHTPD